MIQQREVSVFNENDGTEIDEDTLLSFCPNTLFVVGEGEWLPASTSANESIAIADSNASKPPATEDTSRRPARSVEGIINTKAGGGD